MKNELIDTKKIRKILIDRELSAAELGRRIGLPGREAISRRLQNKYVITGDELFKISTALGVEPSDLRLEA